MMAGSRGSEPSPYDVMLALVTDQKATAERIKQLKAAQDAADERIVQAAAVETANAKRVDELDALMAELDKRKVALDQREAKVEGKEAALAKHQQQHLINVANLDVDQAAIVAAQKQAKANLATERASLDRLAANLDQQQIELQDRIKGCTEREADLANGKAALDADKDAFATRQEALKAALAGV